MNIEQISLSDSPQELSHGLTSNHGLQLTADMLAARCLRLSDQAVPKPKKVILSEEIMKQLSNRQGFAYVELSRISIIAVIHSGTCFPSLFAVFASIGLNLLPAAPSFFIAETIILIVKHFTSFFERILSSSFVFFTMGGDLLKFQVDSKNEHRDADHRY